MYHLTLFLVAHCINTFSHSAILVSQGYPISSGYETSVEEIKIQESTHQILAGFSSRCAPFFMISSLYGYQ